jgi:acyl-CoA thioesterase FadM
MGPNHDPHLYASRAGFLDYAFGHMNNAAYLTHAELARWEMLSYGGLLWHAMSTSTRLVVAGTTVRYRQEIRPFLCPFEVESFFGGIDGRYLWSIHSFRRRQRQRAPSSNTPGEEERIRAQVIVPCVWVREGKVIDPASYLTEAGVDEATVESLRSFGEDLGVLHSVDSSAEDEDEEEEEEPSLTDMAARYGVLEEWMRGYASWHDGRRRGLPLDRRKVMHPQ